MPKRNQFLVLAVLMLLVTHLSAAEVQIKLKLENTTLKLEGETPVITPGDSVSLTIDDPPTPMPRWNFKLDAVQFIQHGAVFRAGAPQTSKPEYSLTIEQGANVSIENGSILLPVGTVETPPPSDRRCAPVKHSYDRAKNRIHVFFDPEGLLRPGSSLPTDMDDNDVITIGIVGKAEDVAKADVVIEGTFVESDRYEVVASGAILDATKIGTALHGSDFAPEGTPCVEFGPFGPFAAPSIKLRMVRVEGATRTTQREYTLKVNKNFFAAYRITALRSDIRFNEFTVASAKDSTQKTIQNIAAEEGETRYFLSIVPYIWWFWEPANWKGRDIEEISVDAEDFRRNLLLRVNPVIGLGLEDAGDEAFLGVSVEVARGVDVVYGWHWAEVDQLGGGFSENNPFTGETAALPIKRKLVRQDGTLGVSIDLRVVSQMLSSLFK